MIDKYKLLFARTHDNTPWSNPTFTNDEIEEILNGLEALKLLKEIRTLAECNAEPRENNNCEIIEKIDKLLENKK